MSFYTAMTPLPKLVSHDLPRALAECSFGIKSSTILTNDHDQGEADVVLLDHGGEEIKVRLSDKGWEVVKPNTLRKETLDELLKTVSPKFLEMWQDRFIGHMELKGLGGKQRYGDWEEDEAQV